MTYRADIDGLRAIAVLLVLLYHGGLTIFPSGFVGVDIFFVISGYLITGILHNSLNNNDLSLIDFYSRRLWRLQPVFISLMVVSTITALIFYLPDDLIQYSRSARKTSLFLSNAHFNKITTGYFSPDTHQLPLLHTWSLSIEWQCYLILPLAMYSLHRVIGNRLLPRAIYLLTIIFTLVSLKFSIDTPAQAYYLLLARMFEFLIGSCVAVTDFNHVFMITARAVSTSHGLSAGSSDMAGSLDSADKPMNKYVFTLIGSVALATLFYIARQQDILLGYPNYFAVIVCLSTATLIALGRNHPHHFIYRLLSFKPLVFIGTLSYSLYIWHWIIFAIIRYQTINETPFVLAMAYLSSGILAYVSWRLIEKPSRAYSTLPFKYTVVCLLVLPIVSTHLSSFLITRHLGFPARFNQELVNIYQALNHYQSTQRTQCIDHPNPRNELACRIGSEKPTSKKGLMIGDSFSNHYWGFMDVLGKASDISITAQGTSSCLTLPGIYLFDWWHFKNTVYEACHQQTERYYDMIQQNHYDYVILAQIWRNYLNDKVINHLGDARSNQLSKARIRHAMNTAIQHIIRSGAKPILIKSSPTMGKNFHDCFFKHIKLRQKYDANQCNFDLIPDSQDHWIDNLMNEMQKKYPQLVVIDPKKAQCIHHRCTADIMGVPVYRDVGHLTDFASYQLGKIYLERYPNPLKG